MSRTPRIYFRKFSKFFLAGGAVGLLGLHLILPLAARGASPEEKKVVLPGGGMPVAITGNPYEEAKKKVADFFDNLTLGGITVLMNTFQVFTQRLAYDVAQRILTGDTGQYPMFWESGFGDYLVDVAEDAGNQFISDINSEFFNPLGFDLCTPMDPFRLQLALGGGGKAQRLQAVCTFAKIGAAFEQTKAAFESTKDVFDAVAPMYNPSASELNVGIRFYNNYLDAQAQSQLAAELERKETQGWKNVKNIISGKIETPSDVARTAFYEAAVKLPMENNKLNYAGMIGNAFEMGFTQLGVLTASTFLNTLASGLMQRLFQGMTGSDVDVAQIDFAQPEAAVNRNVARARIVFSDLLTPNLYSSAQRDFVTELSGCPTPRGLFNCAMDEALATALRTFGESGAYTVGQAAHLTQNNEPPSNPAFLHKEWELIPDADVKNNTDPACYQRAYCASNLAKLRYARILPVGWELAANSPYNFKKNGKYATLENVVRGFYVCNDEGKADAAHPWCKLIDPSWVIAAPPFNCSIKGHGDTVFSGTGLRLQECADAVSCLKRDDRGKCTGGYGYCLAEKPVWRFTADECLERFSSCRTYQTRDKERVSYLRNTLDYGACNADNVGCLWYATERDPSDKSGSAWVGSSTSGPRVYFDATVKTCSAAQDGCTRLLGVTPGKSALNLAQNGSFEQSPPEQEKKLTGWSYKNPNVEYTAPAVDEGDASVYGERSLKSLSGDENTLLSERMVLRELRNYTLSAYIRNIKSDQVGSLGLQLQMYKTASSDVLADGGKFFRSDGCSLLVKEGPYAGFEETIQPSQDSVIWKRVVCSFVSNAGTVSGKLRINGSNVLVDAVQLEEGETPAAFVDGLASGLAEKYLKLSPDEFDCRGAKDDHASCANYARVCSQNDTGCQGYRDVNNPTAPEIPAALSAVDFCPAACVGYAEYRKQASTFDLGKNINERLNDPQDVSAAHFIPAYSQQCALQDVGCEEFTNIEQAKLGGEEKAHFNYVRACEKPGDNSQTYFTWEGSDVAGYQLRTWSLIKNPNTSPAAPKLIEKMGPESILKDPAACSDALWQSGADPDCRQFFDAEGNVFYAYFSQTVVSSPSCVRYRLEKSNAADCGKTGGAYDPVTTQCVYKVLAAESQQCSAVNAGCRAYIGTAGRNTAVVLQESFRGSTSTPFTLGALSNEAVLVGDQSLLISDPDQNKQNLSTATVFKSGANQLYGLSFWAKTTNPKKPIVTIEVDGKAIANFPLEVDWRRYEFGPFAAAKTNAPSELVWLGLPNPTFIDELRVERLLDITYAVKDSWVIPAECDRTPEGLPEPRAMLNCRAYNDRDGKTVNVRRFGHLCREEAVGCKAFIDTRDSDNPYAETFSVKGTNLNTKIKDKAPVQPAYDFEQKYLGTATTTRPADRFRYLIDEPRARCEAAQASCRALGKPKFKQDQLALETPTSSAFETVYLIDDIKQYLTADGAPNMLCRKDELFCDEFKSGKTLAYFRHPQSHVCEWRDKAVLKKNPDAGIPQDGEYTGWFRKGTDLPCYPGILSAGNSFMIRKTADLDYWGWVGLCPIEQSECTEFRDTNDKSDPVHPAGKPYFFIKNQRLDVSSCGGQVNLQRGCILLRDVSDPRSRYSTAATYNKSKAEGDVPQTPIDCVADPDNPFCRKCTDLKYKYVGSEAEKFKAGLAVLCLLHKDIKPLVGTKEAWCAAAVVTPCNPNYPDEAPCILQKPYLDYKIAKDKFDEKFCTEDVDCSITVGYVTTQGKCTKQEIKNDANAVMKVRLDRDCSQWLGCATAETVYDAVQQKYVDVCTETAVCDAVQGANAGAFCANYVNRDRDPLLKPGVFFNREIYTARKTGFGEIDYSGYTVPDQFLAADIENRKVANEIFQKNPSVANKYALDYRLAAAVPENTGLIEFGLNDPLYPNLNLCRHKQTGRTGYYLDGILVGNRVCYFAVDALSQKGELAPGEVDPRNIQPLSDSFRQSKDSLNDTILQRSFPPAECKAYPEGDSPFPNLYVNEWDTAKDPPKRSEAAEGYASANFCEYGENCACSYRKVKYGGQTTRYFSPFGLPPPGGICAGGLKDGEACVPGETISTGPGGAEVPQSAVEDPGCPRGRCQAISDVILVRGQFGQCLQRDYSRFVAGDPSRHPCLVWNPSPILASAYDINHFITTAGYTPPVNAGEYYCLSYAQPPFENIWSARSHTSWTDSKQRGNENGGLGGDGANPYFYLPGQLSKFNYDTGYIAGQCHNADTCGPGESDCTCHDGTSNVAAADADFEEMFLAKDKGDGNALAKIESGSGAGESEDCRKDPLDDSCDVIWRATNLGQGIDGIKPFANGVEGPQAVRCMQAHTGDSDEASSGGPPGTGGTKDGIGFKDADADADYNYGRWIQTVRNKPYLEYFVAVKPKGAARWLYPDVDEGQLDALKIAAVRERNFAQFQFYSKCDAAAAACSLPVWYVDGVEVQDWRDGAQVAQASSQVCSKFGKEFNGTLDKSKESLLVDQDGKPVKLNCTGYEGALLEDYAGDDGGCYYKFWETNYRMEGVRRFEWLANVQVESFWNRRSKVYSQESTCSKSGFAIRAVFENASKAQNNLELAKASPAQLTGPWNFIGFWITACTVGSGGYESSLYLGLRVKHADVCKELAQVISPFSRESATFADRVWNKGNFVIPRLGYSYSANYPPYGSALVTGIPGVEPLFQTGPVENYSKLNPPKFLGSGATYVTLDASPSYKWQYLTNIFARVYRVYQYNDQAVDKNSWACIGGPNHGKSCPVDASQEEGKKICSGTGVCDTALASVQAKNSVHRCNGLSGVNAGVECGGGFAMASLDPICHNAPLAMIEGMLVPQYTNCELRKDKGWVICPNGYYSNVGCEKMSYSEKTAHEEGNAFGCGDKAVVSKAGCRKIESNSKDCPLSVKVKCVMDEGLGPMKGYCAKPYDHARCDYDSDCVFGPGQWWGAYDEGKLTTDPDTPEIPGYVASQTWEQKTHPPWFGKPSVWQWYYPENGGARSPALMPFSNLTTQPWPPPPASQTMYDIKKAHALGGHPWPYIYFGYTRWGAISRVSTVSGVLYRYPSPHPAYEIGEQSKADPAGVVYVTPGLCEGAEGAQMDPKSALFTPEFDTFSHYPSGVAAAGTALQVGVCDGGVKDGQLCFNKSDGGLELWEHGNTCASPPGMGESVCKAVIKSFGGDGSQWPVDECKFDDPGVGDAFTDDPDLDNNTCTHSAGYKPRLDICSDTSSEKCLTGYDLTPGGKQKSLKQSMSLSPTDVTQGWHSPIFLGMSGGNSNDYLHIAYYAPRPPTIAAPDLSRTCASPGSCPVSDVNAFTLENQSAGSLTFGGGKAIVSMKFYGWAAHDQTPLTDAYVDWGDGTLTSIRDVRMKNKKPFCGTTRECELISGLTCQSDSDCPPAGGKCADFGTCSNNSAKFCYRDQDCKIGGLKDAKCNVRMFFGNSDEACEQNFFEFTHAYSCGEKLKAADCEDIMRCNRNPDIKCAIDGDCGFGDTCEAGLAPSGGCFDFDNVVCRYTPKVMLKDNWNWCTGECRAGPISGKEPTDTETAKVKHVYGGCWDGTETKKNIDISTDIMDPEENECFIEPSANPNFRPWIVYPGAVQIGIIQ